MGGGNIWKYSCFLALKTGQSNTLNPIQIPFRRSETMYVVPQADRIVVVYSICFQDKTDQAIAKVFLQAYFLFNASYSSTNI